MNAVAVAPHRGHEVYDTPTRTFRGTVVLLVPPRHREPRGYSGGVVEAVDELDGEGDAHGCITPED